MEFLENGDYFAKIAIFDKNEKEYCFRKYVVRKSYKRMIYDILSTWLIDFKEITSIFWENIKK